ncbi:hypothetical protein TRVL_06596 [Trypanosoma vivax]|nr:hypothetical protein TRVL_06596 [Trypanosoma vivax]
MLLRRRGYAGGVTLFVRREWRVCGRFWERHWFRGTDLRGIGFACVKRCAGAPATFDACFFFARQRRSGVSGVNGEKAFFAGGVVSVDTFHEGMRTERGDSTAWRNKRTQGLYQAQLKRGRNGG